MHFNYTLYGFRVKSEIPLPEVGASRLVDPSSTVHIEVGAVPTSVEEGRALNRFVSATPRCAIIRVPYVGKFLVRNGNHVLVDADPAADPRDVRTFLLGSVFTTLIYQKGLVPLHMSAVVGTGGAATAFSGPRGSGKSTTAATLHFTYGFPVVCDDLAVLRIVDGEPLISAGLYRLRLWKDAAERFKLDPRFLKRELSRAQKFQINAPAMFAKDGCRLTQLFVFERDFNGISKPLRGIENFRAIAKCLQHPWLIQQDHENSSIARTLIDLASLIKVRRMQVHPKEIDGLVSLARQDARTT